RGGGGLVCRWLERVLDRIERVEAVPAADLAPPGVKLLGPQPEYRLAGRAASEHHGPGRRPSRRIQPSRLAPTSSAMKGAQASITSSAWVSSTPDNATRPPGATRAAIAGASTHSGLVRMLATTTAKVSPTGTAECCRRMAAWLRAALSRAASTALSSMSTPSTSPAPSL